MKEDYKEIFKEVNENIKKKYCAICIDTDNLISTNFGTDRDEMIFCKDCYNIQMNILSKGFTIF